ncbi:MAG TPA: hypothetical protein PLV59_01505 [Candidatus Dojkabacteria bacterium]|nr:hypothetical protein [Candidatus Dojkabacteria bacterium]
MAISQRERVFTVAGFDDERVGMQCADILESEEKIHELFITTFATIGFQLFYGERYGYEHNEDRNVLYERGVFIREMGETVGLVEILAMYSLIIGRNTSIEYKEVLDAIQEKSAMTMAFNFPALTLNRYLAFEAVQERIISLILPPEIANETNRAIVRLTSLVFAELITQGKSRTFLHTWV